MYKYFNAPDNLQKLPTTRAAYSDRTAWMMSEISALAYLPFEGKNTFKAMFSAIHGATDALRKTHGEESSKIILDLEASLKIYIDQKIEESKESHSDSSEKSPGLIELKNALKVAGFDLKDTFNQNDTQAFLALRKRDKIAVLSFRGTEANSWKDVKTDLRARFYQTADGEKIHGGFLGAYNQVRDEVKTAVDALEDDYSLYITGHSLGGALAIIATRDLERDTLAACYTFGSPRVGDEEFGDDIRAPIYRVVNTADGVPPSWITYCIVFVVSFIKKEWADYLERRFCGYMHQGDMRYLTACDHDLSKLKLIPNLSMPFRVWRLVKRVLANGLSIAGKDHRIDEYRKKLKHYAECRAKINEDSKR